MTDARALKKIVRDRAARTGESYVTARRHVVERRQPTAHPLLAAQVERYLELGAHELIDMDEHAFRAAADQLLAAASPSEDGKVPDDAGRLSWVLVLPGADPELLLPRMQVRSKAGYVDMDPSTPDRFSTAADVAVPDAPMYLLEAFDPGDALRNLPPSEALRRIRGAGREPVTIAEGVAAVVLHPELLRDKHAFSIIASRSDDTPVRRSVPALWVSRGAPRLGWCWNENPHTWLGSASCVRRHAPG